MILVRSVIVFRPGRAAAKNLSSQTLDGKSEQANDSNLKKEVKDLYKNLIYLSREWPSDLKPQIKNAFAKNHDVTDPEEIRKLIARGEYVCREITATYHLSKYRAMKRRYYNEDREKQLGEMMKDFGQKF